MSDDTPTTPAPKAAAPAPKAPPAQAQQQLIPGAPVPYDRFSEVTEARRRAEATSAELSAKLEGMSGIRQQVEQLSTALQAERIERQTVEVLAGHGIGNAELRDLVRWQYERLPADGRGSFGDVVAAWRADPEQTPYALRPHLHPPTSPSGAPLPRSDQGIVMKTEANKPLDPSRMDLDEYRAHRDTIKGGIWGRKR